MKNLTILLLPSGLLGLLLVVLAANVTRYRFQTRVMLGEGDGGPAHARLRSAIRAHANFTEYVPLTLLLLAADGFAGVPQGWLGWLAGGLVAARLAHAIGMPRPAPNPWRAGGAMLTWAVLLAASLLAIWQAL